MNCIPTREHVDRAASVPESMHRLAHNVVEVTVSSSAVEPLMRRKYFSVAGCRCAGAARSAAAYSRWR